MKIKYLFAVYGDSSQWGLLDEAVVKAESEALQAFDREVSEAGALITRAPLQLDAWTISTGNTAVKDGAPSEPAHRLGCFYMIECSDVADAKKWALKFPLIGHGGFDIIEIRPIAHDEQN